MPPSIASRTMRMLTCSSRSLKPRCQPPRPIAETRSPVRPRILYGISPCPAAADMIPPADDRASPEPVAGSFHLREQVRGRIGRNRAAFDDRRDGRVSSEILGDDLV